MRRIMLSDLFGLAPLLFQKQASLLLFPRLWKVVAMAILVRDRKH